ncbi:MAG: peptidoglycan-binding protein [Clostridia bacterium]|nr:peptidoglycan-binding protein [Clostridia bacterium]
MSTPSDRRLKVRDAYRKFIGRNHYSQKLRNYYNKKYKDGRYYSDCSSSVSGAYKLAGEGFGILNTVGMWTSKKLVDVPVKISKGQITNPDVLRVGDMLLFAGNDTSRKKYGYVGHVEMVGEITYRPAPSDGSGSRVSGGDISDSLALSPADAGRSVSKVTLYGHGSGLAKKHEMTAYCKTRYNTRASTPLGRRGLIRVVRFIRDDGEQLPPAQPAQAAVLKQGATGAAVTAMQKLLLKWDPQCLPKWGADGDFGEETAAAMLAFQLAAGVERTGTFDADTERALLLHAGATVEITGGTVNVRSGPGKQNAVLGVVKKGDRLGYQGVWEHAGDSLWLLVSYTPAGANVPRNAWVSDKFAEVRA